MVMGKINIHLKGKDMDITPSISERVHKQVESIEKYLSLQGDEEALAEFEVGLVSRHHKKGDVFRAELNLNYKGLLFRGVSKKPDMFMAIDEAVSDVARSVKRSLEKKKDVSRRKASKAKGFLRRFLRRKEREELE